MLSSRKPVRDCIPAATILLALVAIAATPAPVTAFPAGPVRATADFDPFQTVIRGGRAVTLSGPITCPAGDIISLRATISQRTSAAVAEGHWTKQCPATTHRTWRTTAPVIDGVSLSAGRAHAIGLAVVRHAAKPVDAFQWQRTITLAAVGRSR
jgi:hypothetical protein